MSDLDLFPMLVIFLFFGLPWVIVYLQARRLAAVEVEVREVATLIKNRERSSDRGGENA